MRVQRHTFDESRGRIGPATSSGLLREEVGLGSGSKLFVTARHQCQRLRMQVRLEENLGIVDDFECNCELLLKLFEQQRVVEELSFSDCLEESFEILLAAGAVVFDELDRGCV